MATIYRFIVEQKTSKSSDGRKGNTSGSKRKTTAKKGKLVSIFGGTKGGVEHNRKLRAINPLLNRITGGWWEKGMRLGRAGMGIVKMNDVSGKLAISGVAVAIILAFVLQMLLKWQQKEIQENEKKNTQDYKRLENGVGAIHGQYKITQNFWNGRITYNQNK